MFIHSGSGNDALNVAGVGGNNVLDGSTGSNFLVGGSGGDQFYVDDRGPTKDIWTTVAGFHAGDAATVWGVTPKDVMTWLHNQGTTGVKGLTLGGNDPGKPNVDLTLAGYSTADLRKRTHGRIRQYHRRTRPLPAEHTATAPVGSLSDHQPAAYATSCFATIAATPVPTPGHGSAHPQSGNRTRASIPSAGVDR